MSWRNSNMRECITSTFDRCLIIIIMIIFAVLAVLILWLMIALETIDIKYIAIILFSCWMSVTYFRSFRISYRKVFYDDERIIVVFSDTDERVYRWEHFNNHFRFSNERIMLLEKNQVNKKIFKWNFKYTKSTFVMQVNYKSKGYHDFVKTLNKNRISVYNRNAI